MWLNIPLTVIPLIAYNIIAFGLLGAFPGDPWSFPIIDKIEMVSGARWSFPMGDLMIVVGLVVLFIEVVKATRTTASSIMDHVLSTVVFIVYLVEFLTVKQAASSVFFVLMVISLIDVLAGFTITIRGARRDLTMGHGGPI